MHVQSLYDRLSFCLVTLNVGIQNCITNHVWTVYYSFVHNDVEKEDEKFVTVYMIIVH